jgi:hypothetical protein
MNLEDFTIYVLITMSTIIGVSSLPNDKLDYWDFEPQWHTKNGFYYFKASSDKIVQACKNKPTAFIEFPTIIHGAHEILLDGKRILTYGDPTFQYTRSFYGAPIINCSEIQNATTLTWKAYSYSKYFARFNFYPKIKENRPISMFFLETSNIIAAGSLIIMAFLCYILFLGKVPLSLTLSLSFANIIIAGYFLGNTIGYFGIQASMLTMHKVADFCVWVGLGLFMNTLRILKLIPNKLYFAYLINIFLACIFVAIGNSGDTIQFGTTLPFPLTLGISGYAIISLIKRTRNTGLTRDAK